jgi:soluble lytic murein transglycosylase-like protein
MCGALLRAAGPRPDVSSVVRPDVHTGRLVRSIVVHPPAGAENTANQPQKLAQTVERIARENQVSPQLVSSVIQVESNYNQYAVSPKGAEGLMQLIPSTARRFGVSDVFDAEDNIQGGARYLKYLLDLYNGDHALALAAYNAGEGAVAHYGGVPPFPETQNYLARVGKRLAKAPRAETQSQPTAVQADGAEKVSAKAHHSIREVMDADGKVYFISR